MLQYQKTPQPDERVRIYPEWTLLEIYNCNANDAYCTITRVISVSRVSRRLPPQRIRCLPTLGNPLLAPLSSSHALGNNAHATAVYGFLNSPQAASTETKFKITLRFILLITGRGCLRAECSGWRKSPPYPLPAI